MKRVRIEISNEPRRLEIIDPAREQRMLARKQGEHYARITRPLSVIDARKQPADLVGVQKVPFMDAFAPTIGRGM